MPRTRKLVTYSLDPDLLARLDAWLATQEFPPAKSAIVEAALKAWLDEREKIAAKGR